MPHPDDGIRAFHCWVATASGPKKKKHGWFEQHKCRVVGQLWNELSEDTLAPFFAVAVQKEHESFTYGRSNDALFGSTIDHLQLKVVEDIIKVKQSQCNAETGCSWDSGRHLCRFGTDATTEQDCEEPAVGGELDRTEMQQRGYIDRR